MFTATAMNWPVPLAKGTFADGAAHVLEIRLVQEDLDEDAAAAENDESLALLLYDTSAELKPSKH